MNVKPWQTLVIVSGLLLGTASVVYSVANFSEPRLEYEAHLIDAETGEYFVLDTRSYIPVLPALNPSTGKESLLLMGRDENGRWHVPRRYLAIGDSMRARNIEFKALDAQTGELTLPLGSPKRYVPPPLTPRGVDAETSR